MSDWVSKWLMDKHIHKGKKRLDKQFYVPHIAEH